MTMLNFFSTFNRESKMLEENKIESSILADCPWLSDEDISVIEFESNSYIIWLNKISPMHLVDIAANKYRNSRENNGDRIHISVFLSRGIVIPSQVSNSLLEISETFSWWDSDYHGASWKRLALAMSNLYPPYSQDDCEKIFERIPEGTRKKIQDKASQ